MKLTPAQQRVVDAMRSGWNLHQGVLGWRLEQDESPYGSEFVAASTARSLGNRGVIQVSAPWFYSLTDAWKEVE